MSELKPEDLLITAPVRSKGGQQVVDTRCPVRVEHTRLGIVIECWHERSQLRNKSLALRLLRTCFEALVSDSWWEEPAPKLRWRMSNRAKEGDLLIEAEGQPLVFVRPRVGQSDIKAAKLAAWLTDQLTRRHDE